MGDSGGGGSAAFVVFLVLGIVLWIAQGLALAEIARKCGEDRKAFWGFVPILQLLLLFDLADASYIGLLAFLFGPGATVMLIWCGWVIAENLDRPGWIGVFFGVPPLSLLAMGYLAWAPEPGARPVPGPIASGPAARPRRIQRGGGRR